MKYILLFLFLFNIFLIVSSEFDVFKLQSKGCENTTLTLQECGKFCNEYLFIENVKSIKVYTDAICYQDPRPYIPFNCSNEINTIGRYGEIICSTLISKYYSFKFVEGPCVDDKLIFLGICSSVCGKNIIINYDPFQNYIITTYLSNDCTGIGSTEFYGSIDCKNQLLSKTNNDQYLSCLKSTPNIESNGSISSKLITIHKFILLTFLLINLLF
ncbi:hypothetical protein DDB_G0283241 [Dictyostelium discoideum AX4]|uniref:Transmembrane protein n=1 Tax=Dictyostelium discoideum TaxID=44689 RepID=Q54RF8_DICDI|nr:hypothetical protein DDB_G0283241 [Dictyostelium discoideum AX4]EAL65859.1 hypothetical protein DDB_G0283241 [Dictyostelium discoideum AX4]|eukprot:XP_639187.1 hypothetical protein DDB_G0283241 [Dictyostelium discoideum AX4]